MSRQSRLLAPVFVSMVGVSGHAAAESPIGKNFYKDHLYVTATARNAAERERLANVEGYFADHDAVVGANRIVLKPKALNQLREAGIPVAIENINVQEMVDNEYRNLRYDGPRQSGIFGPWFNEFPELDASNAYLDEIAKVAPQRGRVSTIGQSHEKRDIRAIRISSAESDGSRAGIIVIATQHAREWIAPMVGMGLADALMRQYDADPRAKKIVDTLNVYVVPIVNVDGYLATRKGERMHRKNMNKTGGSGCDGVDLNRNYPTGYQNGSNCGSDTYPGTGPFSEAESQVVKKLAEGVTNLKWYLEFHSAAQVILVPYNYTRTRPPGYERNKLLGQLYSDALTKTHNVSHPNADGFSAAGGIAYGLAQDWFREKFTDSILAELRQGDSSGGFGISPSKIVPSCEENWNGFLAVATKIAEENPVTPPDGGTDGGTPDGGTPDGGAGRGGSGGSGTGGSSTGGVSGGTGGVAPEGGTAGTGGQGGSSGAGQGGAGTAGNSGAGRSGSIGVTGGVPTGPRNPSVTESCGCSVPGGSGSTPGFLALALSILARILRRKEHRFG